MERGLFELSKAPDDQRLTVLKLTQEGKARAKKNAAVFQRCQRNNPKPSFKSGVAKTGRVA